MTSRLKFYRISLLASLVTLLVACSDDVSIGSSSITYESTSVDGQVSLLHISDVHGATGGYVVINNNVMPYSDDVAIINTGDLEFYHEESHYTNSIAWMVEHWNVSHSDRPYLLLKGNHDAIDIKFPGENSNTTGSEHEANATNYLLKAVQRDLVVWGDENGPGGYWYKDITHNGVKLRIIGTDEYQHSMGVPAPLDGEDPSMKYSKVFSPKQVEWVEATLKSTPSDYYIIMCHHQPLYKVHPAEVLNDFVHHGINGEYDSGGVRKYWSSMSFYRDGNIDLMARIVDAYLHRRHASFTCVNGVAGSSLAVDVDFTGCEPATFACHLNGHTHRDFCEYHPDFPEQLCLTVGCNSPIISSEREDLVRTREGEGSYLLNRVTIDANRKVVIVERIGANELKNESWIVQDGSSRKRIEFPIKHVAAGYLR